MFLWQVLSSDQSCNAALARLQAHRAAAGLRPLSANTGGYCKARKRLPEQLLSQTCLERGEALAARAGADQLWHGRRVKVVDGSSSSMPDTPANQAAYPQPDSQKPGCGFPLVSYVAVFCTATGALLALSTGKWFLHDLSLFYFARGAFRAGEIMLADRGFCSYAELALMKLREVDCVLRLHQRRRSDFRRGRVLGLQDHVVRWSRPARRSRGLRQEDFDRLPAGLDVRELRYRVETQGFRTRQITLATTLLDAAEYPAEDLAELYFRRWDVELDFRHIKTTMQMDVLRCKTPELVRKEIWMHLLAYNLVRWLQWQAADEQASHVRRLSVKGTLQHVLSFDHISRGHRSTTTNNATLLGLIGRQMVPNRPGRVEPRVKKRRPKSYPLMTRPRAELKATLTG